jgi:type II secretory ATPase GspE/PulE/Tfp pilus assembly ATPase PilB-like protein
MMIPSKTFTSPRNPHLHSWEALIDFACRIQASDLHFEAKLNGYIIYYRQHGLLNSLGHINASQSARMIRQLKLFSGCDTTQTRLPQDGRFDWTDGYSCRVNLCPCTLGERIVIRIHRPASQIIQLNQLGFNPDDLDQINQWLRRRQGLLLISGPTGSGKTTTLYAMLDALAKEGCTVLTIEDPVEVLLSSINQIQVNDELGLTPDSILKTILRQDPDVIMVGEIRDHHMLQAAIHAADTGHLVFATIHSNHAVDTFFRLQHLGVKPQSYSSTLSMVVSQRLFPYKDPRHKSQTTNQGRIALFQVCPLHNKLIKALNDGESRQILTKLSGLLGVKTFQQQILKLVQQRRVDEKYLFQCEGI